MVSRMSFKLTYATMFDPPGSCTSASRRALAELRTRSAPSTRFTWAGRTWPPPKAYESARPPTRASCLGRFPLGSARDVRARDRSRRARVLDGWRFTPLAERLRLARRAAALIEERVYRSRRPLALEVGKNRMEALGEAQETADFFAGYADDLERAAATTSRCPTIRCRASARATAAS